MWRCCRCALLGAKGNVGVTVFRVVIAGVEGCSGLGMGMGCGAGARGEVDGLIDGWCLGRLRPCVCGARGVKQ